MAATAQQLNSLLNETNKARQAMYIILDYVELINRNAEGLPSEALSAGDKVRGNAEEMDKHIEEMSHHIYAMLNKTPLNDEEIKLAADKLTLFHGNVDQAMNWTESQKKGHEENSYWWRYWQAVYDKLKGEKAKQ